MTVTPPTGSAPVATGTSLPTFSALVHAVQEHLGCSQNKARRATRDYLKHARRPTVAGLLDHAALVIGAAPHRDPTGDEAARKADRRPRNRRST